MDYNGPRWVCSCGTCDVLIELIKDCKYARCKVCGDSFRKEGGG